MSSTSGTFSQVYADVVPSADATLIAFIAPSALLSDQNGSTIAISRRAASSETARAHASRVGA